MTILPIAQRYPGLLGLPRIPLCDLPTPLEPLTVLSNVLAIPQLWVKRDDLSATNYGGNKIRKLELLLAAAKDRGAQQVLTFGYTGSNFALATAMNAERLGMQCISMLLPQQVEPYVQRNLLLSHKHGAELHMAPNELRLGLKTLARTASGAVSAKGKPFWISAGGSDPLGVIAFVNAAFELAEQLKAAQQSPPDVIYVACGSMGTATGLAIGCAALGWPTRIIATRVVIEKYANLKGISHLAKKTIALIRQYDAGFPKLNDRALNLEIRHDQFGNTYGDVTEACQQALELGHSDNLVLDGTYSGKALASLIADAPNLGAQSVLFWQTHNSVDLKPLVADVDYRDLPKAFHSIFQQ